MRIAVLGGTFDPPHIGHFFLAEILLLELHYTTVFLVPANIPAHKAVKSETRPRERLNMVALEAENLRNTEVSDMEIRRGGTSYSIDTVRELKRRYPELEGKPGLVIGDDLLPNFSEWKEFDALTAEADVIIARRRAERAETIPFPHTYLDNPLLPISSTEIRRRIREKKAYRYLVTEKIYSYIREHRLYDFGN